MKRIEQGGELPSMYLSRLHITAFPNNPLYLRYHHVSNRHKYPLDVAIHPLESGQITIIYPGANESYDGLNERYRRIAYLMQIEELTAVVRSSNPPYNEFLPDISLRQVITYVKRNAQVITGERKPDLVLAGFSAGASAVATLAADYPDVTRILLISPSANMPMGRVRGGLSKFNGEVFVAIGGEEDVVNPKAGNLYFELAQKASHKQLFSLPNCNHFFSDSNCDTLFTDLFFYVAGKTAPTHLPTPSRAA